MTDSQLLEEIRDDIKSIKAMVDTHERDIQAVKVAWVVLKYIGVAIITVCGLLFGWMQVK